MLDTCAYSAFRRGNLGVQSQIQQAEEIVLNPVVLGELYAGFRRGQAVGKNRSELGHFLSSQRVSIVGMDSETAEMYAVILDDLRRAGTPIPTNDIWISATAMQFGLRVVTTDAHFMN